ncbi:MAG: ABC transporter ATP-binding protein [Candidatus Limnocylindrales bacterium]
MTNAPTNVPSNAVDLDFRDATKRYGSTTVVNGLNPHVPAGSICVLVGPSGCGKTTSLRMVNRLVEPTGGQILVGGKDVMSQDPIELRRGIGYVIQQVGLLPHLTVAANVGVVPRLLGWERGRIDERVDELLALVGLDAGRYRDRYPSELSGGERQRIGVARALAADPPLMLMDEPFGAVDPIVREHLQNELLALQERIAKTIVLVTHDIDEAIKMGDLVAVMEVGGVLAQFAPPAEILANPASDFVARFVGADRGLKRLALRRVEELELKPVATARIGADWATRPAPAADDFPYVLAVDDSDRPLGWLQVTDLPSGGSISADMTSPAAPLLTLRTTLKDALAQMLDEDMMAGIVVDGRRRVLGIVTVDQIAGALRDSGLANPAAA